MHSNNIERAHHSVHHVHDLIHRIFTCSAPAGQAAISELMPVFADTFSMVTTGGAIVHRDQVAHLFHRAMGARPGLQILVSDLHTVWQAGDTVAVRYQETHRLAGVSSARLSLVILQATPAGVRWHYLHETALSPEAQ